MTLMQIRYVCSLMKESTKTFIEIDGAGFQLVKDVSFNPSNHSMGCQMRTFCSDVIWRMEVSAIAFH